MDITINGEFSEESAEKENVGDKIAVNTESSSVSSEDKKGSAICSTKENSESKLSNSDSVSPPLAKLSKDANISIQDYASDAVVSNAESKTTNEDIDLSKDVGAHSKPESEESSAINDEVANSSEVSNNSDLKINKSFSLNKNFESDINNESSMELSVSSTNCKIDSIEETVCVLQEKNKSDSFDEFSEHQVNFLPESGNKNESISKVNSGICILTEESNEQICKNDSDSIVSEVDTANNKDDGICKGLEMSELHSEACGNTQNGALPVEQLSHLKSVEDDNVHDSSVTKTSISNELDSSVDKTESSKDSATSQDRDKESDSFVFTEISNEETGFPEVFTGLVTIGKYISVKGDFTLRSSEALLESSSLTAPYLLKEPDTFPPRATPLKNDSRGFFYSTAGKFLFGIGLSRVNEWYHRDMTRIKKRQMKKEGKSPQLEEDLKTHETYYSEAKKANRMYSFPLKSCKTCGFSTESSVVMEGHLLVPHITSRREFQCNFCDAINRDPRAMLDHMYRIHAKTGRIQPPILFFECPYCTFESNSKVKLGNHLTKCQRFYDPNRNQTPSKDFEFPALTPKPITVAVVKAYEKSLSSMQRGRGRPKKMDSITEQMNQYASINPSPLGSGPIPPYRPGSTPALSESLSNLTNQLLPPIQMPNMSLRPPPSSMNQFRSGVSPMHLSASNRLFHVVNSSAQMMPMMGTNSFVTSPSQFPFSPSLVSSGKKLPSHTPNFLNSLFGTGLRQQNSPKSSSEVTITPLPKLQGPYPVPHVKTSTPPNNTSMQGNSLVVCEICDGYIKDLEQLRSHMQLIHKVKIHPKMLVSRPPLNCQKCQWRFFTDQGLERHLLGSHGLVTSNMQELANKSKDAGCCTICGRVYASKLVSHMNQVHKLTLKPAHLSYKCTVCSATFNLYRLFENHVYLVHSGAAKRSADNGSNPSKKFKSSDLDSGVDSEPNNHTEKRTSLDGIARCKDCGKDFRKNSAQTEKCEKCLTYDRQGLKSKMS